VWIAVACVVFAALALTFRDSVMDDAYTGFTYLRNVLRGDGFVFTPGARVEGVTNIGWLLVLLPLVPIVGFTAAAKLVGALSMIGTLVLVERLARRTVPGAAPRWVVPFVLLATASSFELVFFSCAGMETGLLALLVLASIHAFLEGRRVLSALLSLAACLVHPEALLLYPAMLALAPARRSGLRGLLALALGLAFVTLARLATFGSPVPNTFFAKPGSVWQAIDNVTKLLGPDPSPLSQPFASGLLLIPAAIGAARLTRRLGSTGAAVSAAVLVGLAFALYSRPDWTHTGRYFAPYLPCTFILFAHGVRHVEEALATRARALAKPAAWVLLAIAIALPVRELVRFETKGETVHPGFVMVGRTLVDPARWVGDHVPEDAVVACRRIGALSFFSQRRVFDFKYGLTEPRIARIIHATRRFPVLGRNPEYDAIWRDVHPGYVMEDADALAEFESPVDPSDGSIVLLGERFERVHAFNVSLDRTWVLLKRVESAHSPAR